MWFSKKLKSLSFGIPMIWREQQNHYDDCYFCMTNVRGFNKANRHKIVYPNLSSALRPVPHSHDVPVPVPHEEHQPEVDIESDSENEEGAACMYVPPLHHAPKPLTQDELNDFTKDLYLSKSSAQLLGSRLSEKNLLAPGTTYA
jgi:hypothetical protein